MDRQYKIQSIKLKRKKERFQNFLLQRKDYFFDQVNEEMKDEDEEIEKEEEEVKKDEEVNKKLEKNWRAIEYLKKLVKREEGNGNEEIED